MAQDRTAQQHESIRHDEPHAHLVPVPHLKVEWDDHGPTFTHPHVHIRGGGNTYDHHPPGGPTPDDSSGSGHDPITTTPDDLKPDGERADNNDP